MDTLSKYLQLPVEQIRKLSEGNVGFLPEDPIYRFNKNRNDITVTATLYFISSDTFLGGFDNILSIFFTSTPAIFATARLDRP